MRAWEDTRLSCRQKIFSILEIQFVGRIDCSPLSYIHKALCRFSSASTSFNEVPVPKEYMRHYWPRHGYYSRLDGSDFGTMSSF